MILFGIAPAGSKAPWPRAYSARLSISGIRMLEAARPTPMARPDRQLFRLVQIPSLRCRRHPSLCFGARWTWRMGGRKPAARVSVLPFQAPDQAPQGSALIIPGLIGDRFFRRARDYSQVPGFGNEAQGCDIRSVYVESPVTPGRCSNRTAHASFL